MQRCVRRVRGAGVGSGAELLWVVFIVPISVLVAQVVEQVQPFVAIGRIVGPAVVGARGLAGTTEQFRVVFRELAAVAAAAAGVAAAVAPRLVPTLVSAAGIGSRAGVPINGADGCPSAVSGRIAASARVRVRGFCGNIGKPQLRSPAVLIGSATARVAQGASRSRGWFKRRTRRARPSAARRRRRARPPPPPPPPPPPTPVASSGPARL